MITITIPELLALCYDHGACKDALRHLESCDTIEAVMDHPNAEPWSYWLCVSVPDLPDDVRRFAASIACEVPRLAYLLCLHGDRLPADVRRMAELKACVSVIWAGELRRDARDLHPDTIAKLAELGIR